MWKNTQPIRIISKPLLTVFLVCCFVFTGCVEKNVSTEKENRDAETTQAEILQKNEKSGEQTENPYYNEEKPLLQVEEGLFPVFEKSNIPDEVQKKMYGVTISDSSRIGFEDLSYLTLTYVGYDGKSHTGYMIVDKNLADEVISIFKELYEAKFPIEKIRLASEYGGDDELSMEDNNTSSFNDRPVTGGTGLSYHQLGRAIDINPFVNPYVKGSTVLPSTAQEYTDRSLEALGMITEEGECVKVFKKYGWTWGGDWNNLKDYQHFEKK